MNQTMARQHLLREQLRLLVCIFITLTVLSAMSILRASTYRDDTIHKHGFLIGPKPGDVHGGLSIDATTLDPSLCLISGNGASYIAIHPNALILKSRGPNVYLSPDGDAAVFRLTGVDGVAEISASSGTSGDLSLKAHQSTLKSSIFDGNFCDICVLLESARASSLLRFNGGSVEPLWDNTDR